MAKVELIETSEPTTAEPAQVSQSVGSFFMSVSFWLTLTVAGIMYAAVSLSPKLAAWINVRQQYVTNATRLSQLEDEVDYLERVAEALKTDPEFAKRLIRANQNPARMTRSLFLCPKACCLAVRKQKSIQFRRLFDRRSRKLCFIWPVTSSIEPGCSRDPQD
jgi:hypothetical protein